MKRRIAVAAGAALLALAVLYMAPPGLQSALPGAYRVLPGARPVDVYPLEGMVRPGQPVHLKVAVERPW